ncbi:MAG: ABC transporter permease [Anaerolineae bacterium]|nr:ABC transporter permease [Anaerolineae bacterium]
MKRLLSMTSPERVRELILILLIVLVSLFFSSQIPNYFNARFFNRVSTSVAITAVIAIGQTLVFLTRNFDLSVGSIVGFTAYFVGQQLTRNNDIPPALAVLMAVGIGVVMGAINGVIISYGRVPSIITTIGTLAVYRTLLIEFSDAQTVLTAKLPKWVVDLPRVNIISFGDLDIRLVVGIMLLVVVIFQFVLTYLPFGRRLYAIGSNPEAARNAGFPSQQIVFIAFVLSGALSGLAGFLFLARFGNVTVVAGQGLEFASIAAIVVGGVSNNGGSGTVFGALLGAIMIDLLENSLIRWLAISEFWRDAILGMLILLAVASDKLVLSKLRSIWTRSELQITDETVVEKQEAEHHVAKA